MWPRIAPSRGVLFLAISLPLVLQRAESAREGEERGAQLQAKAVLAAAKKHAEGKETAANSTSVKAALEDMSAAELKEEFLAFLKLKAQHHQATAALSCAQQWAQHTEHLKTNQDKLFDGMKKVREANVLLASVNANDWYSIFAGSQQQDQDSATKVWQAIQVGGTLLGRLDNLGENYDHRLKVLVGEDQRQKFMQQCEGGDTQTPQSFNAHTPFSPPERRSPARRVNSLGAGAKIADGNSSDQPTIEDALGDGSLNFTNSTSKQLPQDLDGDGIHNTTQTM